MRIRDSARPETQRLIIGDEHPICCPVSPDSIPRPSATGLLPMAGVHRKVSPDQVSEEAFSFPCLSSGHAGLFRRTRTVTFLPGRPPVPTHHGTSGRKPKEGSGIHTSAAFYPSVS